MGIFGNSKMKLFAGSQKVKKAYLGETKIYSAGNIVTYYVDSSTYYQEEVDSDATCLQPTTFTPTKSGWTFVGWREDTTASSDVLSSKVMGDEPITLYAVFSQDVTITFYDSNSTPVPWYRTRYYNAYGTTSNPIITATQTTISGWTARGWATNTAGNASIAYDNGATITVTGDITLYGCYEKTCTLTAKSYNSTQYAYGTAYYNSAGNTTNATCTVPTGATYSGWTWRGWGSVGSTSASAGVGYANGATYTLGTSDATIYGLYYQTIYLYYNGNGSTSGSVSTQSGTRYYNACGNYDSPSFTLASNGFSRTDYSFTGWNLGAVGATVTLSSSTTAYAQWVQTVTNYGYTGGIQSFTVPITGTYKLAVWGAQGGNGGGYGGYSYGNVTLSAGTIIYIAVGGAGNSHTGAGTSAGGYNGGGTASYSGTTAHILGSGGGATHIATASGVLSELSSNKSAVLIVAGGGGGKMLNDGSTTAVYGSGGGETGGDGKNCTGGTQTTGYAFGLGGSARAGSGGGYYGGTASSGTTQGGAGGSGYIAGVTGGATSNGVQSGNGKATIAFVSAA